MKNFYPVNMNLENMNITVIGMGQVGYRKLSKILHAKKIHIVSKEISDEYLDFIKKYKNISYDIRAYEKSDIQGVNMVFACTDDISVQMQIKDDIENSGLFILANYCKISEYSNFANMSTVQKDDLAFAISTYGKDVKTTKKIRENLEKWYEDAKH